MNELREDKYLQDGLLLSPYKYFAHLKRPKGFSRVRKEDILVFPEICSMCGRESVYGYLGIGRPNLYAFTNIGYVPYCREDYGLVSAIQEYNTFRILSMLAVMIVAVAIGVLMFGLASQRELKGILSLFRRL